MRGWWPALGVSRAKRMLLLAENLSAEEALAGGFLSEIVAAADLDRRVAELSARLAQHAPLTMRVSKEAIRPHYPCWPAGRR